MRKVIFVAWEIDYAALGVDVSIFLESENMRKTELDEKLGTRGFVSGITRDNITYGKTHEMSMSMFLRLCTECNLDPRHYFVTED